MQDAAQLCLDEGALLLDDDELVYRCAELDDGLAHHRVRHAELQDADADIGELLETDAEVGERLHDVEVRLACAHDADWRARRRTDDTIDPVVARVRLRRLEAMLHDEQFLVRHRMGTDRRERLASAPAVPAPPPATDPDGRDHSAPTTAPDGSGSAAPAAGDGGDPAAPPTPALAPPSAQPPSKNLSHFHHPELPIGHGPSFRRAAWPGRPGWRNVSEQVGDSF